MSPNMPADPRFPQRPLLFFLRYVAHWPWHFTGLLVLVSGAAACAVAVQYGMKLLVDAMAAPERSTAAVWWPLGLFIALIGIENVLWRLGGWLGCRTVVGVGVNIRLDLFQHLTGHPMHYFAEHFAGSLGNRITATAGAAVLSAFRASCATDRHLTTRGCIRWRRSGPAARPRARRG
jgi:ATP-binding cassette subfamily B protein